MSDSGNIGNFSGGQVFYRAEGEIGKTGAPVSTGSTLADFQSVITSLGYTAEQISVYMNNPGQPLLVTPQDSGVTVFDTGKFLEDFLFSNPNNQNQGKPAEGKSTTFGQEFQERLGVLLEDPSFLSDIGAKTPEIAETKIKLAFLFPESALSDPEIQKVLTTLTAGAPIGWPGKEDMDVFQRELGQRQDDSFESNLAKMADPNDFTALKNAYYNQKPQDLTEAQKTMFQQIMAASNSELQTTFGIPPNIRVPSQGTEYFNTRLNVDLEDEFTMRLVELKLKGDLNMPGGITEKEFNTLRSMLYFKDPQNPAQAALEGKFQEIYKQTLSEFKTENGLPQNWAPKTQTAVGQAFGDGVWRDSFVENLNKLDIPQELKAQILQGLANPAGASPIVQAILTTLISQTTAAVIEALGLPANWKPVATRPDPNVPLASLLMAKATIANLKDIYAIGLQALKDMPPNDPRRAILMDYLKRIGDALSKMQETLYIIESASAKNSKVLGLAMQDMQKNKIDEAAKQAKIAREQRSSKGYQKQHDSGKATFMKIFGPLIAIILAVLAVLTGNPALIVVALFMLSSSLSKAAGGPDLIKGAFELIGKAVEGICKALGMPPAAIAAVQMLVKIAVIVAVVAICIVSPGGFGMIGTMIMMMFVMESVMKSDLIVDGLKISNPKPSPEEIQKATMAVMISLMVVMMTVMIAQMIVMMVLTGGAGAAPSAAAIAGIGIDLGKVGAQISTTLAEFSAFMLSTFPQLANVVANISKMVGFVSEMIAEIVKGLQYVGMLMQTMLKSVLKLMTDLSKFIAEGAKLLIQTLRTGIADLAKMAPQLVQDAAKFHADNVKIAAKLLADTVRIASDSITKQCEKLINLIKSTQLANSIQTAFPKNTTIAPADAATPTAEIAAATGKGAQLPKIASYAVATGDTLMGVSSMVGGITQAQYSMLMAELVRIQAKSAAYIEEVDALIKLLKKIIESLLNGMNPIAEFITDISTLQAKKYEDSSSAKGWNAI